MKSFVFLFGSLMAILPLMALPEFEFRISESVNTETLHSWKNQRLEFRSYEDGVNSFEYVERWYCDGINAKTFQTQPLDYTTEIKAEDFQQFIDSIRDLDPRLLEVEKAPDPPAEPNPKLEIFGRVVIKGEEFPIRCAKDFPELAKWKAAVGKFQQSHPPTAEQILKPTIMEGDLTPAVSTTIEMVAREAERFQDKRIRLTAFYHREEECNEFRDSKTDPPNFRSSLWAGVKNSSFVPELDLLSNDTYYLLEGAFDGSPGRRGHMGAYPGSLVRLTVCRKATADEIEKAEAASGAVPAKR